MAKKTTTPAVKTDETNKPAPKVANGILAEKLNRPQYEIDIENLQKTVAYLEDKVKRQSEAIHLMKSICDSNEGCIKDLEIKLRRVASVAGVAI